MAAGFEIYGQFYPAVEAFTLGDPVLIRELTGMDFVDFSEAYDELIVELNQAADGEANVDPAVLIGLVGVAVWQANPTWRRDKVVKFVEHLPTDALKLVGDEEEGDDQDPPAPAPEDSRSGGTQTDSSSSAGATANQNGSGDPTSALSVVSESPT